jgi:hypothetical protein
VAFPAGTHQFKTKVRGGAGANAGLPGEATSSRPLSPPSSRRKLGSPPAPLVEGATNANTFPTRPVKGQDNERS